MEAKLSYLWPRNNLLCMTFKEFFSFKNNRFFWINIILMVVVCCVSLWGVLKWLDDYTQHGESVTVPKVSGMFVDEAVSIFNKEGLVCAVVDSSYRKGVAPGSILDQSPVAGMKVKAGRTVYLTINSLSVPLQAVPDVADNSSARQAEAKLLAAGFKLTDNELIAGEKDWVYGVKYNGRRLGFGGKVPTGAKLTLLVGSGEREAVSDSLGADTSSSGEDAVVDDSWF